MEKTRFYNREDLKAKDVARLISIWEGEAGGVDNWTWYDEALTEYNEDDLDDDTLTNEYKDA